MPVIFKLRLHYFDILDEVSEKFGINPAELSRTYIKGALDGLKEKETGGI